MKYRRLYMPESGSIMTLPLSIIISYNYCGQNILLDIYKSLGIGAGKSLYLNRGKLNYNYLAETLPILCGDNINEDWLLLFQRFPDARFVVLSRPGDSRSKEEEAYCDEVRKVIGDKALYLNITDSGIAIKIADFLNIPKHAEIPIQELIGKATLLERIKRFAIARAKWVHAGKPTRDIKIINDIYDNLCSKCEAFDNDSCGICGCRIKRNSKIMNKLAWSTESCPLPGPKWIADMKIDEEEIDQAILEKTIREEITASEPSKPPPSKGCCGH